MAGLPSTQQDQRAPLASFWFLTRETPTESDCVTEGEREAEREGKA